MNSRHFFLSLAFVVACAAENPAPLKIGSELQLFVDDYLIESMTGLRLALHEPRPAGQAIAFDQPWEGNLSAYVTVLKDGDRFRMYYRGASDPDYVNASALRPGERPVPKHPQVTCYAESPDGIRWTKPSLGLHEFNGTKENNIVWTGPGAHNFSPFLDGNPAAPPAERFKAVASLGNGVRGLFAFKSPDGIRWERMGGEPVIRDGAFDSLNVAFWDPVRRLYVAVYRDFLQGVRTIKCATSKDFLHWRRASGPITVKRLPNISTPTRPRPIFGLRRSIWPSRSASCPRERPTTTCRGGAFPTLFS